ncbi:hypothetical protein NDU88_004199 [Pleurodeles waltl]|uniref:Uncharacterized protein n=1 Tax=Pleurodeles waltl TaxID=8319 RepID=A0AAV7V0I9_PLEWA|nr:hypothetical protein NDU88_004199 [Pleurodeles waltl]
MPPCLRAVALAAILVERVADIVVAHPLTLAVPHAVAALLLHSSTQHLSVQRQTHYEQAHLGDTYLMIVKCTTLKPATLLPTAEDGESHDCIQVVAITTILRPDLTDTLLPDADSILYCNVLLCWTIMVLYVFAMWHPSTSATRNAEEKRLGTLERAKERPLVDLTGIKY